MDTLATSRKRPASLPLNAEARQPTASVKSVSLLCARRCLTWPPPPTDNEVMLYRKGGRNRQKKLSHPAYKPPLCFPCVFPVFCTKAKVAKGGVFAGHYGRTKAVYMLERKLKL